jgi:pimeloyl-ACP methyl ester carboxylesterase
MALAGLSNTAVVGSSRGGLIAMAMAAVRPTAIGAVILNDIGPVIERDGLARLIAYVGRVPLPGNWNEATALTKSLNERAFPNQTDATWASVARQIFNDDDGKPAPSYDPKISQAIALSDGPVPGLWPQFAALSRVPMLALRGSNSDILSAATFSEMRRRHPSFEGITLPDHGHTPLLKDADSIGAIYQFLLTTDEVINIANEQTFERPLSA